MRRIMLVTLALSATVFTPMARGQDAATEERLNKLSGQIEDLLAARAADHKRMAEMAREIDSLRELASKPTGNYASQEDLKRLAEVVKEVDRKRMEDNEKFYAQMMKMGKAMASVPPAPKNKPPAASQGESGGTEKTAPPEKGFEYVIQSGDTLSTIAQGCKEKGVKVTVDQILKNNPGLKANSLRVGQKIFIPSAAQASQ